LQFYTTAMLANDRLRARQSQASPLAMSLGRKEGSEDVPLNVLRNPHPGVGDANNNKLLLTLIVRE
jgi:hypothetical protein